jgi:mono/diheme cytochrome c family protein
VVDYVRDKFMERADPQTKASAKPPTATPPGAAAVVASARPAPVPAALKGDKTLGSLLYDNNCVACHGKAGDGNGPRAYFISPRPRSFVSAESRAAFTRPVLINSIAQGKRGTEMPSWDKVLSTQEIANIAEYVFQQFIATDNTAGPSARK